MAPVVRPDGAMKNVELATEALPQLRQLQDLVGGLIQYVPCDPQTSGGSS
jgi:hypothetical protein